MGDEKMREERLFEMPWPKFRAKIDEMGRKELYQMLAFAHGYIQGMNEGLEKGGGAR